MVDAVVAGAVVRSCKVGGVWHGSNVGGVDGGVSLATRHGGATSCWNEDHVSPPETTTRACGGSVSFIIGETPEEPGCAICATISYGVIGCVGSDRAGDGRRGLGTACDGRGSSGARVAVTGLPTTTSG